MKTTSVQDFFKRPLPPVVPIAALLVLCVTPFGYFTQKTHQQALMEQETAVRMSCDRYEIIRQHYEEVLKELGIVYNPAGAAPEIKP